MHGILMTEPKLFSPEHVQLIGLILIPMGSGIVYLIWATAQTKLKVDMIWQWFTNHGSDITGYQPGDEFKRTKK